MIITPDHQFTSFTGVQTMMEDVRNAMYQKMNEFVAQFDTRFKDQNRGKWSLPGNCSKGNDCKRRV